MPQNYIWRDPRDHCTFHIGYERTKRFVDGKWIDVTGEYIILVSLHIDILCDLLGMAGAPRSKWKLVEQRIGLQPRKVGLTLSLPIDMDYSTGEQPC